jgi:AraC-like DNA-binding protein
MSGSSILAAGDGFTVADVRCDGACSGFAAAEEQASHVLATARRGAFVRRVAGREVLIDGTVAYLSAPGVVQRIAHPVSGGDACTAIRLAPGLLAGLAGGDPFVTAADLPLDPASELELRRVTELARRGDPGSDLAERLIRLVAALLARRMQARVGSARPATAAARRRLAREARAAIQAEPRIGLVQLGQVVGCSPHHLSRLFSAQTGVTVSGYRNRVRVGRALERIAGGQQDLAALAAELGFADHAHLTRTVRAVTGHTPTACRALLGSRQPGSRELGLPQPGSRQPGSAELGSAELGSRELGSPELGSPELGSRELGSAELGSRQLGSALPGAATRSRSARAGRSAC